LPRPWRVSSTRTLRRIRSQDVHATRDLRRLNRAALSRLDRLHSIAFDAATLPAEESGTRDRLTAYCIVETHNLWFTYSRSLYISSSLGARSASGGRVSVSKVPRPQSTQEAIGHAIRRCKFNRYKGGRQPWTWLDEPSWAKPNTLLDALDEVGASNYPTVSAALGQINSQFSLAHLGEVRNFYSHRGEDTAMRVRRIALAYAVSPSVSPTQFLHSTAATANGSRAQPIILDWMDETR
jgi:hypothetical protein